MERITLETIVGIGLAESPSPGAAAVRPPRFEAVFVQAGRTRAAGSRPGSLSLAPEALQAAVRQGLFDGRAVFLDHADAGRHPRLRNLAGITAASRWDAASQSVRGELRLYRNAAGRAAASLLREALGQEPAPDIGLSMVFYARPERSEPLAGEENPRTVRKIHMVESVDLVFQPAAGGRVLVQDSAANGLESPATKASFQEENVMNQEQQPEPIRLSLEDAEPQPVPGADPAPAASLAAGLAEAQAAALEAPAIGAQLQVSGLPEASRQKLAGQEYHSVEALQAAIEAEREYLGRLAAAEVVKLGGKAPRGGKIQGGLSATEQLQAALEALVEGRRPPEGVAPLSGIREAYLHLSGDYDMTGVFHPERVALAAVDSASMAGMVANALNKAVVNAFQAYPRWWEPVSINEDFATLQQVKWITLGGVGELPTVSEGAAYSELTWDDQTETSSFVKKGGYLGITIEAIDKDDTRRLQAAPRAIAQAAWLTLSKSISAIFTANSGAGPTLSDGVSLFHANHGNLGSTALSITSYAAARTAMRKQTELNSGERLGALTAPKYLLVPPDLEISALQVLASENDYTYALSNGTAAPANPLASGDGFEARMAYARRRVVVVDLWTDTNNWAAVADPLLYPSIGIGYRYGRTPEVFSVASPRAGLMFSNDVMPVKVRFFYAAGPVDYRGLYKANVA